jgi:hypothetical protein
VQVDEIARLDVTEGLLDMVRRAQALTKGAQG